jgi:hypothetical protein
VRDLAGRKGGAVATVSTAGWVVRLGVVWRRPNSVTALSIVFPYH